MDEVSKRIDDGQTALIQSFSVPLENVKGLAIDSTGTKLIVTDVVRNKAGDFHTSLWTIDLGLGKANEYLKMDAEFVLSQAFVNDSSTIRILTIGDRYEFDMDNTEAGLYKFINNKENFSIGLTSNNHDILMLSPSGYMTIAPWINPWKQVSMMQIPSEAKWVDIAYDHKTIFIGTNLMAQFVDVSSGKIIDEIPTSIEIDAVAAHPTKNVFAVGMQSGTLLFNGIELVGVAGTASMAQVTSLGFSPNGKYLATINENNLVEIWDVDRLLKNTSL